MSDLQSKIEGFLNQYEANCSDKQETADALLKLFNEVMLPITTAKGHLELFITRVQAMRELQIKFFAGHKSVLTKSKAAETVVDEAIRKLTTSLGYLPAEISTVEQKPLFV